MIDFSLLPKIALLYLAVNLAIFRRHTQLFLALGFFIGLLGLIAILADMYHWIYFSFFSEVWKRYLVFHRMENPWGYIHNIPYYLTLYLPIFNLVPRIRSNHRFQFGLLVLFLSNLAYTYWGIGNTVIPGWWSGYSPIPEKFLLLVAGGCAVLTAVLVRFRLLPDLRDKNSSGKISQDL